MAFPGLPSPGSVRERILFVAAALFYSEGVRAVGIDRIIAESSVAKASFYRHFKSKDDLVLAYLYLRHELWMNWFTRQLEAACRRRGNSFERVAEVLALWFRDAAFRGCAFINIMAEGVPSGEIVSVVQSHKADLQACLRALALRMSHPDPDAVSEEALMIVEGTIVRAQVSGDAAISRVAGRAFRRLGVPA